jgi:chlorite dismutase
VATLADVAAEAPAALSCVQALALRVDPAWRRLPPGERCRGALEMAECIERAPGLVSHTYATAGLDAGSDFLVWRLAASVACLEAGAATLLRTSLGRWCSVSTALLGLTGASPYTRRRAAGRPGLFAGDRRRYLVVYPFTKSADWYLMSREARQGIMNEHMEVGHRFPAVRQLLAYSFGIDDQDFLVAYETDDLAAFSSLVHSLRGTEGRRATVRDTPVLVGVHREVGALMHELAS